MSDLLTRRLGLLNSDAHRALLGQGLRGIEREALRVDPKGDLALTSHPIALGSALTNPQITTDYSESLLEFITPPVHDIAIALTQLDAIHRFVHANLGDELLWSQSMPCRLPDEAQIQIARYGKSHIGRLKHVYRRGLALRYGKAMQCIAGIHYNFSLAEETWRVLQADQRAGGSAQDFQSESYVALIRNFRRYSWLLMYLFGASPALDVNFLQGRVHALEKMSDDTLFLPFATSLRMSDLGYRNEAQTGLVPTYNTLREYMTSLARAVRLPHPPYEQLGTRRGGEWVQINGNMLQVENEYYATIRPKRVINTGERPLEALSARGVQYVEVRCLDVDPFDPLGISLETTRFVDAFLLFCALDDSAPTSELEGRENAANFALTVKQGRRPGLKLRRAEKDLELQAWGLELLARIGVAADTLDEQHGGTIHAQALEAQRAKLLAPETTPSARVLQSVRENGGSFARFGMSQSLVHATDFRARPLSRDQIDQFTVLAQVSLAEQEQMERAQSGDFDQFITEYRSRTPIHLCC